MPLCTVTEGKKNPSSTAKKQTKTRQHIPIISKKKIQTLQQLEAQLNKKYLRVWVLKIIQPWGG